MSDVSITKKLVKLNAEFRYQDKHKDNPKADKLKREGFVWKLDSLFDISCPDSENMIKGDKLRSKQAVQEDIKFIKDQRGDRKMSIGKRDEDYDRCIGDDNQSF